MKTQIIQIEPHDDFISVRDKMSWSQAARILLVWPDHEAPLLSRELDLALLQRHARELGAQLAFVTRNPDARFFAGRLFIPVYRNTREAQRSTWRRRRRSENIELAAPDDSEWERKRRQVQLERRPRQVDIPTWQRLIGLTAGLLVVLLIVAVLAPRADITWSPAGTTQIITFTAWTGPSISTVNPSGGVPARPLQVTLEGRRTTQTSGTVEVPGKTAAGRVVFTNLTETAVTIPEGTIVLSADSPPFRYVTSRSGTVQAEAGATLELPVEAAVAGPDSNVASGRITAIQGELGLKLTVTNPASITGGTSQRLAAATEVDQQRVYDELLSSLAETAAEELAAQVSSGDILLSETPTLVSTLQEGYFPGLDAPSDLLEITLQVEFQGYVLAEADLHSLAKSVLDASLPVGFMPVGSQLEYNLLTSPVLAEDDSAQWQMQASRPLQAVTDPEEVIPLLSGKTPQEAAYLIATNQNLEGSPEIRLNPSWWPRLPLFPFQINVRELGS